MRVRFYEAFEEEAEALARALAGSAIAGDVEAEYRWETTQEAHREGFGDTPGVDVISVRTQSELPGAWASHLSKGRGGIVTRSTGYDHILEYRERCGVEVPAGYLPLYCNLAVAEQAMLMWMMLLRKASRQRRQFAGFDRDGITGLECRGKTLVVVGVGNIGSEIARIGLGLGMEVVGVDLERRWDFVEYTDDVEGAIGGADVIACAMNNTAENAGYFSRERLSKCKPGAVFVNVSRGELSPSTVLLEMLESGRLGGVGLDVFDRERLLAAHLRDGESIAEACGGDAEAEAEVRAAVALSARDDAVITPHNAFNTAEAVERKAGHTIVQLESLLGRGEFEWPVPG